MKKLIFLAMSIFAVSACSDEAAKDLSPSTALVLCQNALKRASLDPDKAEIPPVANYGSKGEAYFAWGQSTQMVRMRNGLGLDVAATASCIVDLKSKKITSLTLNSKDLL